jgi:hypothetical protein
MKRRVLRGPATASSVHQGALTRLVVMVAHLERPLALTLTLDGHGVVKPKAADARLRQAGRQLGELAELHVGNIAAERKEGRRQGGCAGACLGHCRCDQGAASMPQPQPLRRQRTFLGGQACHRMCAATLTPVMQKFLPSRP